MIEDSKTSDVLSFGMVDFEIVIPRTSRVSAKLQGLKPSAVTPRIRSASLRATRTRLGRRGWKEDMCLVHSPKDGHTILEASDARTCFTLRVAGNRAQPFRKP